MKNLRISWLIGGGIALLFLFGLSWDVIQSYTSRKSLEIKVRNAAEAGSKFLPFQIKEARDASLTYLKEHGIEPKAEFVSITPDGKKLNVSVISEVSTYVAWIFGSASMKFQGNSTAEVTLKGGGPVEKMNLEEIAFCIENYADFKPGQNIVLWASGDSEVPSYGIKIWKASGDSELNVGKKINIEPITELQQLKEKKIYYVLMLEKVSGNQGTIAGFSAFNGAGLTQSGNLAGQFIRHQIGGTLTRELPEKNNFGLSRGGTPQVKIY